MEYLVDCMKLTREAGIANVLVSNGCISPRAAADILPLVDAANIDLKSFSRETYARVLGGDLDAVLDFIKAAAADIHLELTTLVVPGLNDGAEEIEKCAAFIAGLHGDGVPWHLSAYHPDYRWNAPPTEPALLERIGRRARELLPYVYTGNVPGLSNDTPCPRCGKALVVRRGYRVDAGGLVLKSEEPRPRYYSARCGAPAPVRY
jgi:pyruvate formate lyase activating enzyme